MATQEQKIVQALGGGAGSTHLMCPHCGKRVDLTYRSSYELALDLAVREPPLTRRRDLEMATRADSDAETNIGGASLGATVVAARWWRTPRSTRPFVCHGGRDGPRGGTDQEPAGAAANCGVSHACSADRRPLSGYASSLPRWAPYRAVDPGCARLCHAETLVRPPLTWGMHRHRRNAWPLCLRPSHLRRTQWPPTTIAATTAAVLSSGCRWARPWRLWRARAAVGTPGGSSLCR